MKLQIAFVFFGFACTLANSQATVDPKIWESLETSNTTNILVSFKKADTKGSLATLESLSLSGRINILTTHYHILKKHADVIQYDVRSMLNRVRNKQKKIHKVSQLWITTELILRSVDKDVVELLANHTDVESMTAEWFIPVEDVLEEDTPSQDSNTVQWGVATVGAPTVWDTGIRGEGITIGVIDTGARATHNSIKSTYRGNDEDETHHFNWYAPDGKASKPSDANGHGTHVIGTAAGIDGIGVAPGSRWIACKGCGPSSCSSLDLLECGNWMACPTKTNGAEALCSKAPHVVNNSWFSTGGNSWYDSIIAYWRYAGIIPIFSAGNSGPKCETVGSPADRPGAIAVGSLQSDNRMSDFSSAGPTVDGRMKPDITAPGTSVASASHLSDTGLRTLSGNSMATPHVSGVVALILSNRPKLTIAQVTNALNNGAVGHVAQSRVCGGIRDTTRPNNHVGSGLVSAPNSVEIVPAMSRERSEL